jgi:formyl-CoA transferase
VGTSVLGASVSLVASYLTSHALGTAFHRVGSAHNTLAPYQAFTGSDHKGFILAAGNDGFFAKVVEIVGLPELTDDMRFQTNAARSQNRVALADILQERFSANTSTHWLTRFADGGVPASRINEIEDLAEDEQLRANGYIVDVEHPTIGTLPVIAAPLTFSATPVSLRRPPPRLDEHRADILAVARGETPWLPTTAG